MNNDKFLLEEDDLAQAREICKYIDSDSLRERAVANCLAAEISSKYFSEVEVDISSGIHNVPQVLSDIEISDIYVKGCYIDVRLYFDENGMSVPKSHYELGITPVAYMFIKVDESLSDCSVTGFVLSDKIDTSSDKQGYYQVKESDLVSFYDIEPMLTTQSDSYMPDGFEKVVFDYLDGKLDNKKEFYSAVLASKEARLLLINSAKAKNIFNFVATVDDLQSPILSGDMPEMLEGSGEDLLESFDLNEDVLSENSADTLEEFDVIEQDIPEITLADSTEPEMSDSSGMLSETLPLDNLTENTDYFSSDIENLESIEEVSESFTPSLDIVSDEIGSESAAIDASDVNYEEEISFVSEPTSDYELQEHTELSEAEQDNTDIDLDIVGLEDSSVDNETSQYETTQDEVINELSEFSYETDISPSLDTIESYSDDSDQKESEVSITEEELNYTPPVEQEQLQPQDDNEEINELYANGEPELGQAALPKNKKKSIPLIPILGLFVLLGASGYYGYTKFYASTPDIVNGASMNSTVDSQDSVVEEAPAEEANSMPVETVENVKKSNLTDEGTSVSIPAIEQNLDASIIVSNLSVNWEVPSSYATNAAAKRYLVRIGKILQLNLKTELLLLSKPPITNKISVELQYNKNLRKFEIKDFTLSSGEKTVDDVIKTTLQNTLNMNISSNMNIFENLSGNPVVIIKL